MSLLRRVFLVNAVVLVLSTLALVLTPLTVSFPVVLSEALILLAGLAAMLAVNFVLLRRTVRPLEALAAELEQVDPLRPGRRVTTEDEGAEVARVAEAFNAMANRLEIERGESARRALQAQEEERVRVSRELHDEIGQGLTAAVLELDALARDAPDALRPRVEALREDVRRSLEEVRGVARALRPDALDDLGLAPALAALTAQVGRRAALEVKRVVDLPPALGDGVELVIYRVVQESLTNVVRHASASRAEVHAAVEDGHILVRVMDDGRGFVGPEGAGIRGMRERAVSEHGTLDVRPGSNGGTEVVLELPLS